mmetsp:Transcript_16012/g.44335  ORF Transcript_16012/g.44335 Transcript_16012/m.44335 type:complete len:455 (-) Transcript_16012:1673-3037(-)|eukprot:CAMPEP_0198133212 /NCGR_PEP_ID=MMETSP1442-20131203/59445_1 /TAXON_ID= /ORGANISM="Craspedostauros australis, Strain CCMP3328" /LENGTH=454 /DNA_ID=CAMNT_0043794323 /DNA_START=88 /DNA_END=1452 /DNA_ORIENTATION=-
MKMTNCSSSYAGPSALSLGALLVLLSRAQGFTSIARPVSRVIPSTPSAPSATWRLGHAVDGVARTGLLQMQSGDEVKQTPDTEQKANDSPGLAALNGKRVLPMRIVLAGLGDQQVAGVYAIYNKDYKRGQDGWESCEFVGTSFDLVSSINAHIKVSGADVMAHARILSFSSANSDAMQTVSDEWKVKVKDAVGPFAVRSAMEAALLFDEDDDDDDDFDEDDFDDFPPRSSTNIVRNDDEEEESEVADVKGGAGSGLESKGTDTSASASVSTTEDGQTVSPFAEDTKQAQNTGQDMELNKENVDSTLDEVRPYLIADGGNVSVDRVDPTTGNVYLILEGACGSCPSSTVTMQMGIERVLRENFSNLGEVLQVETEDEAGSDGSIDSLVNKEIDRLKPAVMAMGGKVELRSVDAEGTAEVFFRGPARVQQGLELALLDVDAVERIAFISDDGEGSV